MYRGEVNSYQEDLNDFLSIAEELELKGLTGQHSMEEKNLLETYFKEESPKMKNKPKPTQIVLSETEPELLDVDKFPVQCFADFPEAFNTIIDKVDVQVINLNNEELNKPPKVYLWKLEILGTAGCVAKRV